MARQHPAAAGRDITALAYSSLTARASAGSTRHSCRVMTYLIQSRICLPWAESHSSISCGRVTSILAVGVSSATRDSSKIQNDAEATAARAQPQGHRDRRGSRDRHDCDAARAGLQPPACDRSRPPSRRRPTRCCVVAASRSRRLQDCGSDARIPCRRRREHGYAPRRSWRPGR